MLSLLILITIMFFMLVCMLFLPCVLSLMPQSLIFVFITVLILSGVVFFKSLTKR